MEYNFVASLTLTLDLQKLTSSSLVAAN